MPHPGTTVGLIAAGDDDLGAIEPIWTNLATNGALPGLVRCFVVSAAAASRVRSELERLSGKLPADWSVEVGDAIGDPAGALALVASRHPGADVAWISPRARLPVAWDARLRKAAHAHPAIGAAVPMSDASPLHALVEPGPEAARLDADGLDRTAYCLGDRTYYEVPVPHLACCWLRHDAILAARPVAGEPFGAVIRRMRLAGFGCVACDYVYVACAGPAPAPLAADRVEEAAFRRNDPFGGVRRAVREAIARGLPPVAVPGLDARPVQLHVMHYWGGGLDKWVRDFCRADGSRTNLILASFRIGEEGGQRIVLYADPDSLVPMRTWDIAQPIRSTAVASLEYRRILEQVVREFEVERVIVSSLIWHSLDALALDVPSFVVFHDFHPVCQAINPTFGRPCERCEPADLRRCAASNPLNATFRDLTADEWLSLRGRFVDRLLERKIEVVVPSPSVAATLRRLEPRLAAVPMRVIAHGIDFDAQPLPAPAIAPGERLRLVVLGRHTELKGSRLLREAAPGLAPHAEVTLLGCGAAGVEAAGELGWRAVERYEPRELPGLLRELAPHAGLLASIVPETFSYTLSELLALGIPPLATAMGSFRDRIADGETGFLFEPDAASLVAAVRRLREEPARLAAVAARLAEAGPARTAAQMVADYEPLLAQGERAVARFAVGLGWQSGLTEPYRQLDRAYAELTEAYAGTRAAYEERTQAYDQLREAYDRKSAAYDAAAAELEVRRKGIGAWLSPAGRKETGQ